MNVQTNKEMNNFTKVIPHLVSVGDVCDEAERLFLDRHRVPAFQNHHHKLQIHKNHYQHKLEKKLPHTEETDYQHNLQKHKCYVLSCHVRIRCQMTIKYNLIFQLMRKLFITTQIYFISR